jgi:hypothetical protein
MESETNEKRSVYYKDKAAYNQALLEAIKDARKQRVDDPGRGFPNAVLALENILFNEERKQVNVYKYDTGEYIDEIKAARSKADKAREKNLGVEIFLNEIKSLSWPLFRHYCDKFYNDGVFPDLDGNGQIDRKDITIAIYDALESKIICILQENGWLTWESEGETAGGGGAGLSDNSGVDGIDDDLNFSGG